MQHDVVSNPADHLIILLEHAREEANEAGLMEVCFIVELAIAATVEAIGEIGTSPGAAAA